MRIDWEVGSSSCNALHQRMAEVEVDGLYYELLEVSAVWGTES
jgi:hypothetical protein